MAWFNPEQMFFSDFITNTVINRLDIKKFGMGVHQYSHPLLAQQNFTPQILNPIHFLLLHHIPHIFRGSHAERDLE